MKIKEILKTKGSKVWTIRADQTIRDAVKILVQQKIGALLVMDDQDTIIGIISERDIVRSLHNHPSDIAEIPVQKLMTKDVIAASPEDDTSYLMGIMTQSRIRHIPVICEGKLEGLVSIGDVVKSQLQDSEYEIHYLKKYLYHSNQP